MLFPLLDNFDSVNNVKKPSGLHNPPGFAKDLDLIIKHLKRYDILKYHKGRAHKTIPNPRDTLHASIIVNTFNFIDTIVIFFFIQMY